MDTLTTRCVSGITANRDHLGQGVQHSPGIVTALVPFIGYPTSARIAKQALDTGENVGNIVVAAGLLTREQVDEILSPRQLTGFSTAPKYS